MFTETQKWRVLDAIRNARNIHIVTHLGPDMDGAAASFLLLRKARRSSFSESVYYHFVPNGETLRLAEVPVDLLPGEQDIVIHVDTGGRIDINLTQREHEPLVIILDEHYEGCPYPSATRIVYELLYVREKQTPPKYAQDLVAYVDRVDSGNTVGRLSNEDRDSLAVMNELLSEEFGDRPIGRFVPNQPGPTWISTLVKNPPRGTSDVLHLQVMIYALEAHAEKAVKNYELGNFYEKEAYRRTVNGVNLVVFPANSFNSKDLRSFLNLHYHGETDLLLSVVTPISHFAPKGRFVIEFLSGKSERLAGLREAKELLESSIPGIQIHLEGDWALFIKASPASENLTSEFLIDVLERTLRLKDNTHQEAMHA